MTLDEVLAAHKEKRDYNDQDVIDVIWWAQAVDEYEGAHEPRYRDRHLASRVYDALLEVGYLRGGDQT